MLSRSRLKAFQVQQLKMTTSIAEAILQAALLLRKAGVVDSRRDAGALLAYLLGRDRSFMLSHAEDVVGAEQLAQFHELLARRALGEPLQYLTGRQEFYGLEFEVNEAVLIPRPETELLVETALKLVTAGAPYICDVGTGSGCIVVTLLHELGQTSGARAVALDVSPAALEVAMRNAARHAVAQQIEFAVSDCFAALEPQGGTFKFDLIVSNPPYVTDGELAGLQREVRDFEPHLALTAGPDGLAVIRRLLVGAGRFLRTGGHFLFEIGFEQSVTVVQLIDLERWELLDIHQDLQGIPRIVALKKRAVSTD
jgi:release factor glutamine methyltransferase